MTGLPFSESDCTDSLAWWIAVMLTDKYYNIFQEDSAGLNIFLEPWVESSFSFVDHVPDAEFNRMNIIIWSIIQNIKYWLCSKRMSLFNTHSSVNKELRLVMCTMEEKKRKEGKGGGLQRKKKWKGKENLTSLIWSVSVKSKNRLEDARLTLGTDGQEKEV